MGLVGYTPGDTFIKRGRSLFARQGLASKQEREDLSRNQLSTLNELLSLLSCENIVVLLKPRWRGLLQLPDRNKTAQGGLKV